MAFAGHFSILPEVSTDSCRSLTPCRLLSRNRLESRLEHPYGHPFAEDGGTQLAYVDFVVLFLRLRDVHAHGPRCRDGHALEAAEARRCRLQTVGTYVPHGNTHRQEQQTFESVGDGCIVLSVFVFLHFYVYWISHAPSARTTSRSSGSRNSSSVGISPMLNHLRRPIYRQADLHFSECIRVFVRL